MCIITMNLKELYKDPSFSGSLAGKKTFFNAVKKRNPSVKRSAVEGFLKSEDTYTLHKPIQKPKRFRRIITHGIAFLYQIDLVDMSMYSEENEGYNWIICVIDCFSKVLWAFKTKNKRGLTVTKTLEALLTANTPRFIETDGGTEFKNSNFKALLKKLGIKTYSVYSDRKCAIVERVNRTLKTRMERLFTSSGSHSWHQSLDALVAGYNGTWHSSIKRTPLEVTPENSSEVHRILYPISEPLFNPKLKVGDTVRVTRKKNIFEKGYKRTWSYEVFTIERVQRTDPVTYTIVDQSKEIIKGAFYENDLQEVDKSSAVYPIERIVRKRNRQGSVQYLVKFIGYPDTYNSWVNQEDLFDL